MKDDDDDVRWMKEMMMRLMDEGDDDAMDLSIFYLLSIYHVSV